MSIASTTVSLLRRSPGSVLVTFGSLTTYGLLDHAQEGMDMGGGQLQVIGETLTLTIGTDSLAGLRKGSAITTAPKEAPASATSYKVRMITRVDDGGLSRAWLEVP